MHLRILGGSLWALLVLVVLSVYLWMWAHDAEAASSGDRRRSGRSSGGRRRGDRRTGRRLDR